MLATTKEFENNNTILFECKYRDADNIMYDPTTPSYIIQDMQGNQIATGTPLKRVTGHYYISWTPTIVGHYTLIFSGFIALKKVTIRKPFRIIEHGINT